MVTNATGPHGPRPRIQSNARSINPDCFTQRSTRANATRRMTTRTIRRIFLAKGVPESSLMRSACRLFVQRPVVIRVADGSRFLYVRREVQRDKLHDRT